jgi:hypothetical protein
VKVFVLLIPTLLSFLILAAHFLRGDQTALMLACCAAPLLLLPRRAWATRAVQVLLVLGALEWVWTTLQIRGVRIDQGREWGRMAAILGGVAAFTFASSLVYFLPPLRRHYCRRGRTEAPPADPPMFQPAAGNPRMAAR